MRKFLRLAVLHDDAAVDEDDPVGCLTGKAHLVGHHQHGHALLRQRLHDAQHLAHHFRVQRGGRLVEEHDLRLQGQRTGDGDALLLAAGELIGIGVTLVRQPHGLEQGHGPLLGGLFIHTLHLHRGQHDVVQHRLVGKRLNCWNTMPMPSRSLVLSLDGAVTRSVPW